MNRKHPEVQGKPWEDNSGGLHWDEHNTTNFEGWAVVEMMGHQREVGYVTTEVYGAAVLFRVDVPELPEREYTLERPEWIWKGGLEDGAIAPAGSTVKRAASPARTKLIGVAAIYAITPCTEETARAAVEELIRRPLILLNLAEPTKALPAAKPDDEVRFFHCCDGAPEEGHAENCPQEGRS